jgi:hypothetical protein
MVTKKELVEGIKMLNKAGIGIKIKTVGIKEADLKESFMATIDEILDAGKQKSIPEKIALLYNTLVEEEEEKPESTNEVEEKPEPVEEKKPKETKNPEPKKPEEKTKNTGDKKIPITTRLMMFVVDSPDSSLDTIKTKLEEEGYQPKMTTISTLRNDVLKVVKYINSKTK